ncbi:MAG: hypothetical protein HOO86_02440 [Bacteroidales bacterium]|nr:hypothetical protein [Bacteroidales bacterium]
MRNILLTILLTFVVAIMKGQETIMLEKSPIEITSFTTDRDLYLTEETIWFSAKIDCFEKEVIDVLSTVLYVELYDDQLKPIIRQKFKIIDGKCQGSFIIPGDIISGSYFLRVYTMYLRNFDPKFYPEKIITIINPIVPPAKNELSDTIEITTNYNYLSCNIPNTIALRIAPLFVNKIEKIEIVSDSNISVDCFPPNYRGFTSLVFTPESGHNYRLLIKSVEGDLFSKSLPSVDSVRVNNFSQLFDDQYNIGFINKPDLPKVIILTVFNKKLEPYLSKQFDTGNQFISISTSALLPGLNYIVIADQGGNTLHVESLIVASNQKNKLYVTTSKKSYTPREKVILHLEPLSGLPVNSTVQISVVKKGSSFLHQDLFSDLFAPEKNADSLELSASKKAAENAALMFYNQQFKDRDYCKKLFSFSVSPIHWIPETKDITISGLLRNKTTREPVQNVSVFASVIDAKPQLHINKTGIDGSFIFSLLNVNDSKKIFFNVQSPFSDQFEILLNNDFSNEFHSRHIKPLNMDTSMRVLLTEMLLNQQLSKVFTQYPVSEVVNASNEVNLFGKPDYTVILDDYIDLDSFEEVFKEIVPFVKIKRTKTQANFEVLDINRGITYNDPLVMLDEITIFDIHSLFKINPKLIEKIDVFTNPYIFGDQIFNGIIIIHTKSKNFGRITLPSSSVFIDYQTITQQNIFKGRNYSQPADDIKHIPDYRTTLYWNPSLVLKSTGTDVEFYTSDHKSQYDVFVTELGINGAILIGHTTFDVKND